MGKGSRLFLLLMAVFSSVVWRADAVGANDAIAASLARSQDHKEFRNCITHAVHACGPWNADYVLVQPHEPTLSKTLDWIGQRLAKAGVVHKFYHAGCKVAIDAKDGSPVQLMWQEKQDGAFKAVSRLIFHPSILGGPTAEGLMGNGYTTYFHENYRHIGTPESPKRLVYYNDATVIDLSALREIKNYVGTSDGGELFLVHGPTSTIKFNFRKDAFDRENFVGASLPEEGAAVWVDGPVPLGDAEAPKEVFGETYFHFETQESHPQYILMLPSEDIAFNLNITKAFLHAISLCELGEGLNG